MKRRDFLLAAGMASLGLSACARKDAADGGGQPERATSGPTGGSFADSGPLYMVSLAEWSVNKAVRGGELDHLDFPKKARSFDLDAVEYVSTLFADRSAKADYLAELNRRCKGEGVRSLLIMVDGEGNLGDPDSAARARAVTNHHRWVDAAVVLGCHSIRVNAHSRGSYDEQLALAADGLATLAEYGDRAGINIIVENHGGLSSNGAWLAAVMAKANHPRVGTLPDFGNFGLGDGKNYDRYQGVKELMPFAKAVSAKSYDFKDGKETTIDYERMMRIVVDAGYRGYVGIEYEGSRLGEDDGIRATRDLLLATRKSLTS